MPVQFAHKLFIRVRSALTRDRKQSGIMVGIGLTMLVCWVRMQLRGPASATATSIRQPVPVAINGPLTISKHLGSRSLLEWLGKPKEVVNRNLFAVHTEHYPFAGASWRPAIPLLNSADELTNPTAGDPEDQGASENLETKAAKLVLQGTMIGTSPEAIVCGKLINEGDVIAGFTVTRILYRKVVIQQNGVVFELAMP